MGTIPDETVFALVEEPMQQVNGRVANLRVCSDDLHSHFDRS